MSEWPMAFDGVVESVVATPGRDGRWNLAALGLHAGSPVTAVTWGRTRTARNFEREGVGYVQFTRDPVDFVEAALSVVERDEPVLASADAWVRVRAVEGGRGTERGTRWIRWELEPRESTVRNEHVAPLDRALAAVVEASVAASRLGVAGYDDAVLRDRLAWCEGVVDSAGGPRERAAFERVVECAQADVGASSDGESEPSTNESL